MDTAHLQLLPKLDALTNHSRVLKLVVEVLDEVSLVLPVSPTQVSSSLFTGLEGKHVIELVVSWVPEGPPEGEAQLLPPAPPVVVEDGCKLVEVLPLGHLRVVKLDKVHDPSLASR